MIIFRPRIFYLEMVKRKRKINNNNYEQIAAVLLANIIYRGDNSRHENAVAFDSTAIREALC